MSAFLLLMLLWIVAPVGLVALLVLLARSRLFDESGNDGLDI